MRLSEWRKAAPSRESMTSRVLAVVEPVLSALGAERDPYCWVIWGEDPQMRYSVFIPTRAGLATVAVRVEIPGEGPRANGKLVRWSRLQLSELTMESQGGHRLIAMQVEGQVLRGMDGEADRIAEFVRGLIAAMDGREWQPPESSIAAPAGRGTAAGVGGAPGPRGAAASAPAGESKAATKAPRTKASAAAKAGASGRGGRTTAAGRRGNGERAGFPALGPGTSREQDDGDDETGQGRAGRDD